MKAIDFTGFLFRRRVARAPDGAVGFRPISPIWGFATAPGSEGIGSYAVARKRTQASEIIGARKVVRGAPGQRKSAGPRETRSFAGRRKQLRITAETAWAPARCGGNGALFRWSRNYCDSADNTPAARPLGLHGSTPQKLVNDVVWSALPLWHVERRRRLTLVAPESCPMVRRSHGYPVFLPRLRTGRPSRRLPSCLFMTTR